MSIVERAEMMTTLICEIPDHPMKSDEVRSLLMMHFRVHALDKIEDENDV